MTLSADEALAQFKQSGDVEEVKRKYPEIPLLKITDKVGLYVQGILKQYRETEFGRFARIKLIATDAEAIKRNGQKDENGKYVYVPTTVNAGDDASFSVPTRLAFVMKDMVEGTEVFIKYTGKIDQVVNGRKVRPHTFDIRAKKVEKPF